MSQEEMLSVFAFVIKVMDDGIRKSLLVNFVFSLIRDLGQRLALVEFHLLQSLQPRATLTSNNEFLSLRKGERGWLHRPLRVVSTVMVSLCKTCTCPPHDPETASSCV